MLRARVVAADPIAMWGCLMKIVRLGVVVGVLVASVVGYLLVSGGSSSERLHFLTETEFVGGRDCYGKGPVIVAIHHDVGLGEVWLDFEADGVIDAISDGSKVVFRGTDGVFTGDQWWSVSRDLDDPVAVLLSVTEVGEILLTLFQDTDESLALWRSLGDKVKEGVSSPVRLVEGEPGSPELAWTVDEEGEVASARLTFLHAEPTEPSSVTIHRLPEDEVPRLPSVSSVSSSDLADAPALPFVSTFPPFIAGCTPGIDEVGRWECVKDLVGDLTIGAWVEQQGLDEALQVTPCRTL